MAKPTYLLQIGFGTTPFATADVWTDITSDMQEFHVRRGRQHELDRMEAGIATFVLDNASHDYYPDNATGTYSPNVACMKKVNLQAIHGDGTYHLYTGYAQSWAPFWKGQLTVAPSIRLNCADALRSFARYLVNGTTFPQQTSGTRVIGVLDSFGFPSADREIDAGQELVMGTTAVNINALDHLQSVQESELGLLYQSANGDIIYEDRAHRTLGAHGTAQATFGDDAGEQKYAAVDFAFEDTLLYNEVRALRIGGTEQTASYANSIAKYGVRTLNRSNLLLVSDVAAKVHALRIGARYSDVTKSRVKSITISAGRDETNLYPKTLGYEISTRIGVRLDQAGIDDEYFIEGINHDWTAKSNNLITKWQLSETTQYHTTPDAQSDILRPNGTGGITQLLGTPGANWTNVDEPDKDYDTSYNYETDFASYLNKDLYRFDAPPYGNGDINSVTITAWGRSSVIATTQGNMTPLIQCNGTNVNAAGTYLAGTQWHTTSTVWGTNALTGDPWSWGVLNDIQAGVILNSPVTSGIPQGDARCTQLYLTVNYTPTW